jgi:succinate dehydrogenase / fumarate reductase flavoprotein subunit
VGEKTFSLFSRFIESTGEGNIGQIRDEMRSLMTEKVGVFRTEEGLTEAIEKLKELKEQADRIGLATRGLRMNQDLVQHWELENLLQVSMVIAQSALWRRESRGGHSRMDYPERKDQFNHHTLAFTSELGEVRFEKRPVDMSIYESKDEHYEKFGMIERKY